MIFNNGKSHFYTSMGSWPWTCKRRCFLLFLSQLNHSSSFILPNNPLGFWPRVLFEKMNSFSCFNLYIKNSWISSSRLWCIFHVLFTYLGLDDLLLKWPSSTCPWSPGPNSNLEAYLMVKKLQMHKGILNVFSKNVLKMQTF